MGALRTGYLVLYNLASTAAWSFLLFELVKFQSSGAPQTEIYKTLNVPLKIAQSTAVLEVLHAVFKIVRSNPLNTFLQVLSRVTVLYCLLDMFEEAVVPITIGEFVVPHVSLMLFAWCFAEIPRYLFLAVNSIGTPPYILTFIRYSGFLILYPLGVFGELCVFYQAIGVIKEQYETAWPYLGDVSLPNKLNFSFSFYQLIVGGVLAYIPGFPLLYSHMLSLRANKLGPKEKME